MKETATSRPAIYTKTRVETIVSRTEVFDFCFAKKYGVASVTSLMGDRLSEFKRQTA